MTDIGSILGRLRAILDTMEGLRGQLKELQERKDSLEGALQHHMDDAGIDSVKNDEAGLSVSLRDELVPQYDPEHYEDIFHWCADKGRPDFIQRRMSGAKIREYVESGGELPKGLTLTPITKISFRRS